MYEYITDLQLFNKSNVSLCIAVQSDSRGFGEAMITNVG